ncbi:helix-turn-helix domain-containing protein [Candidatus Bathyarchaeota archaeon]|nr:helix-turn-helix domain-containing protein [Candidatus Bathyarchaeota archaeon]
MAKYDDEYREFLSRLCAARIEAGLTQKEVAKFLRKAQSYVSKCESGERRVDVVELRAFASLYNKSINDFLETN